MVGEGVCVTVGLCVDVFVGVDVRVALCEAVGLCVAVDVLVSVARIRVEVTDGIAEEVGITVGVGTTSGLRNRIEKSASNTTTARMIGMAYLRSTPGRVAAGTTGILPVYPSVLNRLLRLSA